MSVEEWAALLAPPLESCKVPTYGSIPGKTEYYSRDRVAQALSMSELLAALEKAPIAELSKYLRGDMDAKGIGPTDIDVAVDLFDGLVSALSVKAREWSSAKDDESDRRLERLFRTCETLSLQSERETPESASFFRFVLYELGTLLVQRDPANQTFIQASHLDGVFQLQVDASVPFDSLAERLAYPKDRDRFRVRFRVGENTDFKTFRRYAAFYLRRGHYLFSIARGAEEIPVSFTFVDDADDFVNDGSENTTLIRFPANNRMSVVLDSVLDCQRRGSRPVIYLSSDTGVIPPEMARGIGNEKAKKLSHIVSKLEKWNSIVSDCCELAGRIQDQSEKTGATTIRPSPLGIVPSWRLQRLDNADALLKRLFEAPRNSSDVWYVEDKSAIRNALLSLGVDSSPEYRLAEKLDDIFWTGLNGHVRSDIAQSALFLGNGEDTMGILELFIDAEISEMEKVMRSLVSHWLHQGDVL